MSYLSKNPLKPLAIFLLLQASYLFSASDADFFMAGYGADIDIYNIRATGQGNGGLQGGFMIVGEELEYTYYECQVKFDESEDNEVLSDEAENLGYTIDLQGGSPRFVNKNIIDWASNVDIRGSVEFPVLMQVLGMKFRFGAEMGTFKFENKIPKQEADGSLLKVGDTYSGITAMGILAFPAGPGKIKLGTGIVGASPGFIMEATYGIRIGGVLDIRGGFRSTEVINAITKEDVELGHTGWVDGIIVLGINL